MLKKYYSRATAKDGEAKKNGSDGDASGFPVVESSSSSGDQPWTCPTASASGSERGPRCGEGSPSFLDWSGHSITFSRKDHPNCIPNPGQYPLVVDSVIGNVRFSKVQMDGGSNLNILYAHTLRLMGIGLDQVRTSMTSSHGITPSKRVQPLRQIDLPVWFGPPANFRKEKRSPTRWWGSGVRITPALGGLATPSPWRSRTTPTSR
jgi:hypothetical protein